MKLYAITATFMVVGEDEEDILETLEVMNINFNELDNIGIQVADDCLPGWEGCFPYRTSADTPRKTCSEWIKK